MLFRNSLGIIRAKLGGPSSSIIYNINGYLDINLGMRKKNCVTFYKRPLRRSYLVRVRGITSMRYSRGK